jgi:hypothetical protein
MFGSTIFRPGALAGVFTAVAVVTLAGPAASEPKPRTPPRGRPGENLATVRVALPPAGPAKVVVIRHHGSRTSPKKGDASWFSVCLPDRKYLETWRETDPQLPERRLWDRALKKQGYEALVYLQGSGNDVAPACFGTADAMSMKHTDLHPGYRTYVKDALTGTVPPSPPHNPFVAPMLE